MEFKDRYVQYVQGKTDSLSVAGQLIAMTLVVWAASFGLNEAGMEDLQLDVGDTRSRKETINEMLQELLYLVDLHGILRKACWDGVRLLLLLLPLTQGVYFTYSSFFPRPHNHITNRNTATNGSIGKFLLADLRRTLTRS